MTGTLAYIEDFFSGNLSDEQKRIFEDKCENDPAFAREVSFYITTRAMIRSERHAQIRKEGNGPATVVTFSPVKSSAILRKFTPYITLAAACLLLFIGWVIFVNNPSPQKLASGYIEQNLQTLSINMSGSQDSLQQGIAAFNSGNYGKAQEIFQSLTHKKAVAPEALKNLGILYLINKEYDKAISAFDSLSANQNLYANPGPFLKAVTLMKRFEGRDSEQAREILQEVKQSKLPGSKEAEEWLKKW